MRIVPKIAIPILLTAFFVYLPFIANSRLLLDRNNDLTEFFWPIINYIKQSIFIYHQIPLWNNLFFLGTPLVSDPQSIYWYFPNMIFLFLPINTGIFATYIAHTIFGGVGMYLAAREFKLSKVSSIFAACLFISSSKLSGYLEAGHFGLVLSFAWLPWVTVSIKKLTSSPKLIWSIVLSLSLTSIFFNHILTAAIVLIAASIFGGILFIKNPNKKTLIYSLTAIILFTITVSPLVILQKQWLPQTTRDLLLIYPDVYPKWNSKVEFVKNFFFPISLATEKIITFGIFPSIMLIVGFLKLKRTLKIGLAVVFSIIFLVSLNNASPIYHLLINQNWYIELRVATRLWFIITLACIVLAAFGFDVINKKQRVTSYILAALAIIESLLIGYKIISKPIISGSNAPKEVYELLKSDKDYFHVFCTTRCLSQKDASIYELHLAEGYGTLPQKNYYEAAKQIGQYYSNRYSLSIPPFDIYLYNQLQPHSPTLSIYGIKYVISPHPLNDKNLSQINFISGYRVYKNNLFVSPNYNYYSPNLIIIDNRREKNIITISEIYNQNWKAFDQTSKRLNVSETPAHILQIEAKNAKTIYLKFLPF